METLTPRVQANPDDTINRAVERAVEGDFRSRFPRQLEHCQRLIAERLQLSLKLKDGSISAYEIEALVRSLEILERMR